MMKYHVKIFETDQQGDLNKVYDEAGTDISHKDISIPVNPKHEFIDENGAIEWFKKHADPISKKNLQLKYCYVCLYNDADDLIYEINIK